MVRRKLAVDPLSRAARYGCPVDGPADLGAQKVGKAQLPLAAVGTLPVAVGFGVFIGRGIGEAVTTGRRLWLVSSPNSDFSRDSLLPICIKPFGSDLVAVDTQVVPNRIGEGKSQPLVGCPDREESRPDLSKKFFQSCFGFLLRRHGVTSDVFFRHMSRIFDGVFESFFFADFS